MSNDTERSPLVIVAEDEAILRLVIAQTFEECGFSVLSASDGMEALHFLRDHPECCLLVSDIRMPNMNGYDLARNALNFQTHPTILLLTGFADPIPKSLKNRVTLLHKPMAVDELCARAIAICGQPPAGIR